jgi:hypothetical protein
LKYKYSLMGSKIAKPQSMPTTVSNLSSFIMLTYGNPHSSIKTDTTELMKLYAVENLLASFTLNTKIHLSNNIPCANLDKISVEKFLFSSNNQCFLW